MLMCTPNCYQFSGHGVPAAAHFIRKSIDSSSMGHVPGAINIALRDSEARLAEFPPVHELVAYCHGAHCVLSFEAVAALRAQGFKARRLQDGLPEWKAAGLPVEIDFGRQRTRHLRQLIRARCLLDDALLRVRGKHHSASMAEAPSPPRARAPYVRCWQERQRVTCCRVYLSGS